MSVKAGRNQAAGSSPRAAQLAEKFQVLSRRAVIRWTWEPAMATSAVNYFASGPDPELETLDGFEYVPHAEVRNWNKVDLLILTAPGADLSNRVQEYRRRHPKMIIVAWLWESQLAHADNLKTVMACDMYFPAHAYSAAYLGNLNCPTGLPVPLGVAHWTGVEARALLAELAGTPRADQLLLSYADGLEAQRAALVAQLRTELALPPAPPRLADDQGFDLSQAHRARLTEWLGHKCILILPSDRELVPQLFEALLAGLVVIVPRLMADFDQLFAPELQERLGIVRIDKLDLPTIRAAMAQAVANFDRLGMAGVQARTDFVLDGHMLSHRLHTILQAARTAGQRREWVTYPNIVAEASAAVEAGRYDEAIVAFKLAVQGPAAADPTARFKFGTALLTLGRNGEALAQFDIVLAKHPHDALVLNNYAVALNKQNRISEAEAVLQRILAKQPDHHDALVNMAHCLLLQGRTRESESYYRRAMSCARANCAAHSSVLLTMLYHETDGTRLRQEHEKVAALLTKGVIVGPPSVRVPTAKIRVGFISPDFRLHSVAYFALPLVVALAREQFEVWCYSDVARADQVTALFQKHADHYIPIFGRADAEVAAQIRADGMDILFDLAGHTSNSRVRLLAAHPAARQVSWLGYPATTGLAAMDYRLTDAIADPAGAEAYYTEQLIRLPGGFLCYLGASDAPMPNALPQLSRGYVTFGSFNNVAKIQPETVRLWSLVLKALPNARLLLKARPFGDPRLAGYVVALFAAEGIEAARLDLRSQLEGTTAHLAAYGEIDIALDTMPYNGTTTTCEALWMGVPVVTRVGAVHHARVGASLLAQVGLGAFTATSDEQFVAKAVYLASDAERLAGLRRGLRAAMAASPLCDSRRFAREVGEAIQSMLTA
jgi:predicted O-linked N-acetylglucosamine transferase (SPINDLY family)